MKSGRSRMLLIGGAGVLVLAALVFFRGELGAAVTAAAAWTTGLGPLGVAVFAALYAVATVFAIPGSALSLIAGGAFGFGAGILAVWVGATAGLALAFLVARRLARDRVTRWLSTRPSFAAVDRAVAAEGGKIVFLTRLAPVFPFVALNYAYGLTGVRFSAYLLASAVGILPGTMFFIYLGSSAARTLSGQAGPLELALRAAGVAAFVLVTILITRTARRALRDAGVEAGGGAP